MTQPVRSIVMPDLSSRPFAAQVARSLATAPKQVYAAFTTQWEQWFAERGTAIVEPIAGQPFFFQTQHENQRHPHYGRYLRLEPYRLVELTWLTGAKGTGGAETVLTVEIKSEAGGSAVKLRHAGFHDEAAAEQHRQAWQGPVLDLLDRRFAS